MVLKTCSAQVSWYCLVRALSTASYSDMLGGACVVSTCCVKRSMTLLELLSATSAADSCSVWNLTKYTR